MQCFCGGFLKNRAKSLDPIVLDLLTCLLAFRMHKEQENKMEKKKFGKKDPLQTENHVENLRTKPCLKNTHTHTQRNHLPFAIVQPMGAAWAVFRNSPYLI